MPRRERPEKTSRSEHWLRGAVNKCPDYLNAQVRGAFAWPASEAITWVSPLASDGYAEYYDDAFVERLGIAPLAVPLQSFWPASGPRWDALARTASGKIILVEAKAHIDESVDYGTGASGASRDKIERALADAKQAFGASEHASWGAPFYQYANRLAHLYFLSELNGCEAYMLFLYFADAPDVPSPCADAEWRGAIRLTKRCLGLGAHRFVNRVGDLILRVPDMPIKSG